MWRGRGPHGQSARWRVAEDTGLEPAGPFEFTARHNSSAPAIFSPVVNRRPRTQFRSLDYTWYFYFDYLFIYLFFTSGDSQACPPGQQWSRCVIGAVSCTDVSMDLSRNCTPGCQCPQGRVQQVCKKPALTPQLGDSIRSYRSDRSSFSQPPGRCVCARVWLSLQRGGTAIPTRRRCPYRLQ